MVLSESSDIDIFNMKIYKFKPFKFERIITYGYRNAIPKPRSGHRVVCNNGNLYSYGGYNPGIDDKDPEMRRNMDWLESRPLFREVWKFNFARQVWTKLPVRHIPSVLASNAVVLSGNILMVYGGTGVPFGGHCSNVLHVCDLSEDVQTFRVVQVSGVKPEPQYGQAILLIGHCLYVIGGTTGYEYSSDVHRLNLATGIWEQVYICTGSFNEPEGRYRHELGFDGRRIFVLGGGTADVAFGFEEMPVFDIKTREWLRVSTHPDPKTLGSGFPPPRRFHSCIQKPSSNAVIIIGGFNGEDIIDDTWQLDLDSLQWENLSETKLPLPTYFHSSAVTPAGKLVSFGGINLKSKRTERSSDVHFSWICIPKLKEIAWEAIQFYKLTSNLTPSELRCFGYPEEFIERL